MANDCTARQAEVLSDFGYSPNGVTFDQASELMQKLKDNNWQPLPDGPPKTNEAVADPPGVHAATPPAGETANAAHNELDGTGPCTPKQAALLEKFGYDSNKTFDCASATIDALANNGWKRPDADNTPAAQATTDEIPTFSS